jgi:hypothetical protein
MIRGMQRLFAISSVSGRASIAESASGQNLGAKAARAVRCEVNMPTRAIAAVLLRADEPVLYRDLYLRSSEYGLFQSHRHFKHVLRMMKGQRRVQVMTGPPERAGGSKLSFQVRLTRRGELIYSQYLGNEIPPPPPKEAPSLANATQEV